MRRIKLTVAYDGSDYCGWQLQPGFPTIEGELNKALTQIEGREISVIGASRTDSGVHSLGNVAVFDSDSTIPADRFPYVVNRLLPEDIRVMKGEEVPSDFHPRHCDTRKTYEYTIYVSDISNPKERLYAYRHYAPLNTDLMNEAASVLIGTHDFTSFCSAKTDKEDKTRTIYELNVRQEKNKYIIHVEGNGFLYNMVRIIAGTLLRAGEEEMSAKKIEEALLLKDRALAGPTLPACGLTLVGITYL